MRKRESSHVFFSGYKHTGLLAKVSSKATNNELKSSCNQLQREVVWLLDRWETAHNLLVVEQENTSRWENLYYTLQLKFLQLEDQFEAKHSQSESQEEDHNGRPTCT
jgi:hypothetical protein